MESLPNTPKPNVSELRLLQTSKKPLNTSGVSGLSGGQITGTPLLMDGVIIVNTGARIGPGRAVETMDFIVIYQIVLPIMSS